VIEIAAGLREHTPQPDPELRKVLAFPFREPLETRAVDDRSVERREDGFAVREGPKGEDALAFATGVANSDVYRNMSLSCGRTYERAVSLPSGIGRPRTIAAGRRSSLPITSSVAAAISSAIAISVTRIS
jgi:hypothetical protein